MTWSDYEVSSVEEGGMIRQGLVVYACRVSASSPAAEG